MNTTLTMAAATYGLICNARLAANLKSRMSTSIIAMILLATLAMPLPLPAQDGQDRNQKHHHYKQVDLGTFGGPNAYYESDPPEIIISSRGVVAASADTLVLDPYCIDSPDCYVSRAFLWHDGTRTKLESLPGGSSSFTYSINAGGKTVGAAEKATLIR